MIQLTERPEARFAGLVEPVTQLRRLALAALGRMYRPEEGLFAFRLRREAGADVLEGVSCRYSAIVLLALAQEAPEEAARILAGHRMEDVCARLSGQVAQADDLGEVGLTLWAARVLDQPVEAALARLGELDPLSGGYPTVESSWVLTALIGCRARGGCERPARRAGGAPARFVSSRGGPVSAYTGRW